MMDGWYMTAWNWFWMALAMGGGALLLILVVLLVARGASSASRGEHQPSEDPTEIVARRFARGEIDEAEYRRRLDTLHHGPRPTVGRNNDDDGSAAVPGQ